MLKLDLRKDKAINLLIYFDIQDEALKMVGIEICLNIHHKPAKNFSDKHHLFRQVFFSVSKTRVILILILSFFNLFSEKANFGICIRFKKGLFDYKR